MGCFQHFAVMNSDKMETVACVLGTFYQDNQDRFLSRTASSKDHCTGSYAKGSESSFHKVYVVILSDSVTQSAKVKNPIFILINRHSWCILARSYAMVSTSDILWWWDSL